MTYCVAIKVDAGLVFASDSRTHGGVDNVNIYSKMHCFSTSADRTLVLLSAGNLATTQAVINILQRELGDRNCKQDLNNYQYMFDVAHHIGKVSRGIQKDFADDQQQQGHSFAASFVLGGQIKGCAPELFLIYPEGNYIAVSTENPFLQIGEAKYGKPILDRIIRPETPLNDAGRCALVSIDSTMRSNLSVGPPIELLHYKTDSFHTKYRNTFHEKDPYLTTLRESWNSGIQILFYELPKFDWEN